jgi:DNA mismatch repair ATPase MutS
MVAFASLSIIFGLISVLLKICATEPVGAESQLEEDEESANDRVGDIKRRLKKLASDNPNLDELVVRLKKHLKTIKYHKEMLDEIRPSQNEYMIEQIRDSFDIVEMEICQNIEDIMNICLISGSQHGHVKWSQVDQEAIMIELQSNEEKLEKTDELLKKLVDMVNQHDNETTNMDLDSWITVVDTKLNTPTNSSR